MGGQYLKFCNISGWGRGELATGRVHNVSKLNYILLLNSNCHTV